MTDCELRNGFDANSIRAVQTIEFQVVRNPREGFAHPPSNLMGRPGRV